MCDVSGEGKIGIQISHLMTFERVRLHKAMPLELLASLSQWMLVIDLSLVTLRRYQKLAAFEPKL